MKKIKFSHDYEKLPINWEDTQAFLLSVVRADINVLSKWLPEFIKADTFYHETNDLGEQEEKHYPLNFSDGIILFFVHANGKLFTTIRRYTPQKYEYYLEGEFKWFELVKT